MARAFIILLDSFGIGATDDAEEFGDKGANTLGHIVDYCHENKANQPALRYGPLHIPELLKLGINKAMEISIGRPCPHLPIEASIEGMYGCAEEVSHGKDTQSGHWEIAGVPVLFEWGYFPPEYPSFPSELLEKFIEETQIPGILGNKHASGTVILTELGEEHERTGKPIVYTSADSVFQIAAHEETFGLDRLYKICETARRLVDPYNIGRVIARPFLGKKGNYYRTGNRKDYATPPPEQTLLDKLVEQGREVIAIGKVADIYAHQGISTVIKGNGNNALMDAFITQIKEAPDNSLVFVNLVDFDMLYGHRRDVVGYAKALEDFDLRLLEVRALLKKDDLVIITADHGCDPTWKGSDHTREHIPILAFGPSIPAKSIGKRKTFADIGQSIAKHLSLTPLKYGVSFL